MSMSKYGANGDDDDRPEPPPPPPDRGRYRREILKQRIREGSIAKAPAGYLYHPGNLLVSVRDQGVVASRLKTLGLTPMVAGITSYMVAHLHVESEKTVPELMAFLRHPDPRSGRIPLLAPNHILAGAQGHIMAEGGGPYDFAVPAPPPEFAKPGEPGRITVGILDTGLSLLRQKPENPFLAGVAVEDPVNDNDRPLSGGRLNDESGHGTFVTGVVLQQAPRARVVVHKALDNEGFGRETDVRDALIEFVAKEKPDILNLSFGGHADHEAPLLALGAAISALDPSIVVVAAAGNQAQSMPFWPAAQKRVIGVGALDRARARAKAGGPAPSDYSNFGWWVDAWALGKWVSTFFTNDDAPPVTLANGQVVEGPRSFKGWAQWEGTSFATAAVCGAIAALAEDATITPRQAAFELTEAAGVARVPPNQGSGAIVA